MRSSGVLIPTAARWLPTAALLVATAAVASSCVATPVEWEPFEYVNSGPPSPALVFTPDSRLCAAAFSALGDYHYQAGWSHSGELLVLKSADAGVSWDTPVVADARERSADVCGRSAPALFADSINGYLHVAYYGEPPGGSGVYYVHSMYPEQLAQVGAGMFEQPLALTYGTRPVRAAVASRGDTVVVAYEDPNSPRGSLGIALSTTGGHSFDHRLAASTAAAEMPDVGLRAGGLLIRWREAAAPQRWMQRSGKFR